LARMCGARKVIIIGTEEDEKVRLPIARDMGFETLNIQKENIDERISRITGKGKVDVVLECSGAPQALLTSLNILRKGGDLVLLGLPSKTVEFPFAQLIRSEINLITSYTSTWQDYELTLKYLADGVLNIKPLCKTYPLDKAVEAFEDAISKKVLKPVLIP